MHSVMWGIYSVNVFWGGYCVSDMILCIMPLGWYHNSELKVRLSYNYKLECTLKNDERQKNCICRVIAYGIR